MKLKSPNVWFIFGTVPVLVLDFVLGAAVQSAVAKDGKATVTYQLRKDGSEKQIEADVVLLAGFAALDRALLTDPQTSGGLLVACAPAALDAVLACFARHGFDEAAVVGEVGAASDAPSLRVAG